jgi:hypothetical protein
LYPKKWESTSESKEWFPSFWVLPEAK